MDEQLLKDSLTILAKLVRNQHTAISLMCRYFSATMEMHDLTKAEQDAGKTLSEIEASVRDFVSTRLKELEQVADSGDEVTQSLDDLLNRLK
jgi:hypothetical protein